MRGQGERIALNCRRLLSANKYCQGGWKIKHLKGDFEFKRNLLAVGFSRSRTRHRVPASLPRTKCSSSLWEVCQREQRARTSYCGAVLSALCSPTEAARSVTARGVAAPAACHCAAPGCGGVPRAWTEGTSAEQGGTEGFLLLLTRLFGFFGWGS